MKYPRRDFIVTLNKEKSKANQEKYKTIITVIVYMFTIEENIVEQIKL